MTNASAVISRVDFASFGNPRGDCLQGFVQGSCHVPNSTALVEQACLGKRICILYPEMFSPFLTSPGCQPPTLPSAWLSVSVSCEGLPPNYLHTYWNFTLLDEFLLDFWSAVDGNKTGAVPNWSTPPNWLYSSTWNYQDEYRSPFGGYESGSSPARSLTLLGDYYGRLLAWYTRGGFYDENNLFRRSNHFLNISVYEIYNEVDYEHSHTPRSYVEDFDAIVLGIRKHADPTHRIRYVGLSLPNIDSTATIEEFARYFLDPRNHDPAVKFDSSQVFIGFHSYPTNGPYTPGSPTTLENLFVYGDEFLQRVRDVDALLAKESPHTQTYLDECGTALDNMIDTPLYWVASGSLFAYVFAGVSGMSGSSVVQVGQSQLADGPGQEPSVSMLDWTTGLGNARYAVSALLGECMAAGDVYVATNVSVAAQGHYFFPALDDPLSSRLLSPSASPLFAQAFLAAGAPGVARVLLINKRSAVGNVTLELTGLPPMHSKGDFFHDGVGRTGDHRKDVPCVVKFVDVSTPLPYGQAACNYDERGRLVVLLREFSTAIISVG